MDILNLEESVLQAHDGIEYLPTITDPVLRTMTQETWRGRMVNEYGSSFVFEQFAEQCSRHAKTLRFEESTLERLKEFAQEERRHGVLCGAVTKAFGGAAKAPALNSPPFPFHEEVEPLEGILRNLLSICCLNETVAVALIAAEREDMPAGVLKDILTEIWSDECGHAHFGWRQLASWLPDDVDLKRRLGDYLAIAFGHLESHELSHLPLSSNPPLEGAQYGLCSGKEARALFYATVEGIIIPNLETYGIPARWSWDNRYTE